MDTYGKETIIDLDDCNKLLFTRYYLKKYFIELCDLIDMKREKICWWDDIGISEEEKQNLPHTKGTSAVQFILTSNITIHTLDMLCKVMVNIFSCKDYDENIAIKFTKEFFQGKIKSQNVILRG